MHRQLNNKYEVLIIPIDYNKSFLDFTRKEIQNYFAWFLNVKDQRLFNFCTYLFADQKDCLSENNFKVIEMFLLNSVSTLQKPLEQYNEEMKRVPSHFKPFVKPDDYLFDEMTISICYDIGIFMGELIINLDKQIFWKLETDDEFSDYGQPTLAKKKNKFEVNPFVVAKNAAAKISKGTYTEGQLASFFNAWKKAFKIDNV